MVRVLFFDTDISSTGSYLCFWTLLRLYFSSTWTLLRQYFFSTTHQENRKKPFFSAFGTPRKVTDLALRAKSVTDCLLYLPRVVGIQ